VHQIKDERTRQERGRRRSQDAALLEQGADSANTERRRVDHIRLVKSPRGIMRRRYTQPPRHDRRAQEYDNHRGEFAMDDHADAA
jgi:hypothetical protein